MPDYGYPLRDVFGTFPQINWVLDKSTIALAPWWYSTILKWNKVHLYSPHHKKVHPLRMILVSSFTLIYMTSKWLGITSPPVRNRVKSIYKSDEEKSIRNFNKLYLLSRINKVFCFYRNYDSRYAIANLWKWKLEKLIYFSN